MIKFKGATVDAVCVLYLPGDMNLVVQVIASVEKTFKFLFPVSEITAGSVGWR